MTEAVARSADRHRPGKLAPRGVAVHVGLNSVDPSHYSGWTGELAGCENDARVMLRLSSSRGFEATTILGPEATAQAVLDAVSGGAASLRPGDIFVLTYSGPGGELPDSTGRKVNHLHETWALYDRQLLVDEVEAGCWAFQAGVRMLMIVDTCHTGTMTRAMSYRSAYLPDPVPGGAGYANPEQMKTKNLPKDIEQRTFLTNRELYLEVQQALPVDSDNGGQMAADVIHISGCAADQVATDGVPNGVFTATLMRVMEDGSFRGSYRDLYHGLSNLMPASQSPSYYRLGRVNQAFDRQSPFSI